MKKQKKMTAEQYLRMRKRQIRKQKAQEKKLMEELYVIDLARRCLRAILR